VPLENLALVDTLLHGTVEPSAKTSQARSQLSKTVLAPSGELVDLQGHKALLVNTPCRLCALRQQRARKVNE
jgi:hypothetical protein